MDRGGRSPSRCRCGGKGVDLGLVGCVVGTSRLSNWNEMGGDKQAVGEELAVTVAEACRLGGGSEPEEEEAAGRGGGCGHDHDSRRRRIASRGATRGREGGITLPVLPISLSPFLLLLLLLPRNLSQFSLGIMVILTLMMTKEFSFTFFFAPAEMETPNFGGDVSGSHSLFTSSWFGSVQPHLLSASRCIALVMTTTTFSTAKFSSSSFTNRFN